MNRNHQTLSWFLALAITAALPLSLAFAETTALPDNQANHLIAIPRLSDHPQPTTDLSAAPWNKAACVTSFFEAYEQSFAKNPTWAYLFYDPETLWVAFRCEGIAGDKLVACATERDSKVWLDDSVELFINPGSVRASHFQSIFNQAGVIFDSAGGFKSFNANVTIQTATDEQGWTLVAGIPFAALNANPQPGQAWGINLCRMSSLPEKSRWAPVTGGFHLPQFFGQLVLGGENNPAARFRKVGPIVIGKNTITLDHANGLQFEVIGTTESKEMIHVDKGIVSTDDKLEFILPNDRIRHIALSLIDRQGRQLARCWYPMSSPEISRKITALHNQLAELSSALKAFPPNTIQKTQTIFNTTSSRIDQEVQDLQNPKRHTAANWKRLYRAFCDLELKLDGPACLAKTLKHYPNASFAVGLQTGMQKVMIKDFAFDGHFDNTCKLTMARNEHEAFQVVVIPFPNDLKQVTVSTSPLLSKDGHKPFAGGKVEVSLVGHVDVHDIPRYDADYHGFWPDVLIDFQQSCDAQVGEHVSFWVNVSTSSETPPGAYEGTITVAAAGCEPIHVRLYVHVWDFALPQGTHLPNAFTYREETMPKFYGDKWTKELARKYNDFLLDHRLNIDHLYRRDLPNIDLMAYGVSKGMTAFNLGAPLRRVGAGKEPPGVREYIDALKKKGLFDEAYVYGYDEANEEKFPQIRQVFGGIHKIWPDLKTMTTAYDPSFGQDTGLRDVVDIWCPLTEWYDLDERNKLRTEGKYMWWYTCIVPVHPYANWFIEYPAIESRLLMGAMTYKYQADGFLYYLINLWRNNREPISAGPYTKWDPASFLEYRDPHNKKRLTMTGNGDGLLIYPGPDGPLSSIRLENIRDGLEDYEYLYMVQQIADRVRQSPEHPDRTQYLKIVEPLLAVPDSLVKSVTEYTRDPETLASYRLKLAAVILAGEKLLEQTTGP